MPNGTYRPQHEQILRELRQDFGRTTAMVIAAIPDAHERIV